MSLPGEGTLPGWGAALGALAGLLLVWGVLVGVLWWSRPRGDRLTESLRLLPDLLRLVARLARDRALPVAVRARLWALLAYLAFPVDLVPDVVPVLGYADDAVLVVLVLRGVLRRAGPQALGRHWPGTPDGLEAVLRLVGGRGRGLPRSAGAGPDRPDDLDQHRGPADGPGE